MADKIDQIKIGSTSWDIDLPPDAAPSIASITTSGNATIGGTISEGGTTLANKYLGKSAKAADSDKLDGNDSTYYLNYNNLTNKPTIPSSFNITVTDDILDGTGGANSVKYAPYSSKAAGKLYTGSTTPTSSNRLNYDGYFYATKLYSGDSEVATMAAIPNWQETMTIVGNALTNLNGRTLSSYEATLTTGVYTYYTITYGGVKCTETQARNYMEYMTGSRYLPQYDYEKPKNSIFMFADRTFWKPQYDTNNGLQLYRLSTALALESSLPQILDLRS